MYTYHFPVYVRFVNFHKTRLFLVIFHHRLFSSCIHRSIFTDPNLFSRHHSLFSFVGHARVFERRCLRDMTPENTILSAVSSRPHSRILMFEVLHNKPTGESLMLAIKARAWSFTGFEWTLWSRPSGLDRLCDWRL